MNDPGLDEPISNDAKDVEKQHEDEEDEKIEDEQAFLEPRYVDSASISIATPARGRQSKAVTGGLPRVSAETFILFPYSSVPLYNANGTSLSRWWYASTAFPLVAGTFGPMASAFSICALVVHWRVHIPPGAAEQNGVPIDDPKWYVPTSYTPCEHP